VSGGHGWPKRTSGDGAWATPKPPAGRDRWALLVAGLWMVLSAGAAKVSSLAHAVPRRAGRSDSPSRVLLRSSTLADPGLVLCAGKDAHFAAASEGL
jgi:hypothetical protein